MSALIALQHAITRRVFPALNRRLVSTSKKSNETAVLDTVKTAATKKTEHKNWITYGFDASSKEGDRNALHSITFVSVTLCLVLGGYFLIYIPDFNLRNWSQREAFLEIRRREKLGLPLVDPNLIDPAKITLPTDEELGDQEIII